MGVRISLKLEQLEPYRDQPGQQYWSEGFSQLMAPLVLAQILDLVATCSGPAENSGAADHDSNGIAA